MQIRNSVDAIAILGGTHEVGKMFNPPLDYRVIHNWKHPKRGLPPDSYAVLGPALVSLGHKFSPLLFGQKVPAWGLSYFPPPPSLKPVRKRNGQRDYEVAPAIVPSPAA